MAEQQTRERDDSGSSDTSGTSGEHAESSESKNSGSTESENAESSDTSGSSKDSDSGSSKDSESSSGSSEGSADGGSSSDEDSGKDGDGDGDGDGGPARRSAQHAKPSELTEEERAAQDANRDQFTRGGRRGRDDGEPRRSLDASELIWRSSGVLATLVRIVTLVFAVVLVADIVLRVVGVNPTNGVAQFVSGFAEAVVLAFRDLFLPSDPTVALVLNYGLAAVFWVLVGGFLSSGVRWLAARVA